MQAAKAEDSKNFETLKAKGMEIYTPPVAVRDAMAAKGKPSWTAFEDAVPAAKPVAAIPMPPTDGPPAIPLPPVPPPDPHRW